jgi:hypothetical protein
MIAMTQEDISGITDIVVEPYAWIAYQGQWTFMRDMT